MLASLEKFPSIASFTTRELALGKYCISFEIVQGNLNEVLPVFKIIDGSECDLFISILLDNESGILSLDRDLINKLPANVEITLSYTIV